MNGYCENDCPLYRLENQVVSLRALVKELASHSRYIDRKEAETFKARIATVLGSNGGTP
jgi:hypothetical protein